MEHYSCDVLVVGGGGAALRAAIAAKEWKADLKVLLVTKGILGKSGVTATACSDRMAFHATLPHTPPGGPDAWRYHAEDIYRIGGQVSDSDLAEILARNSGEAFTYLDNLGVPFVKSDGLPRQFVTDGSEYPRACYTGPRTAVHIEERLVKHFRSLDIPVIEHCMVAKLVTDGERVIGALAVGTRERKDPEAALKVIQAKTVILATGGGGLIFKHNVFQAGMTGDGYALAYDVGAELVNMEFIQMGVASTKTKLNCSGSMLRAVPRIIDETGREFLADYFPPGTPWSQVYDTVFRKGASWPVSYEHDTHLIDIAIYKKVREGHRVYLDYAQNPEGFIFTDLPGRDRERYWQEMVADLGEEARQASPLNRLKEINPDSIQWLKEHGIDLEAGEKVEVAVCGQHFQGGVKIRAKGNTTVPALYAVGETAGGQHGANRPGGNALLDCQVFGRIAGEAAAQEAVARREKPVPSEAVDSFMGHLKELSSGGGLTAREFRQQLQELVETSAGVVRTGEGLKEGLVYLQDLKNTRMATGDRTLAYALENENMLVVAEMVMQVALLRDESRGPHLRFAGATVNNPICRKDPEWQQYIVIARRGGEKVLEKRIPHGGIGR